MGKVCFVIDAAARGIGDGGRNAFLSGMESPSLLRGSISWCNHGLVGDRRDGRLGEYAGAPRGDR